jgi:SAM-dependent methyltransferase
MMNTPAFDDLSDVYQRLIDWPKRLAHEGPFYRGLFAEIGARRVADVACGTGHHAAMFHSWQLDVEASDIAGRMIDLARASFGEPPGLRWVVRGFDEPVSQPETFDAAICVGNSLALAPDAATARRAIGQMLSAVRPAGTVVIQVLNLPSLPDGPCVWQKCRRVRLPELGDALVLKGVHRRGLRGFVDLVVMDVEGGRLRHCESVALLGFEADGLVAMARQAGATSTEVFGGYQRQPYDRSGSVDLILVAHK